MPWDEFAETEEWIELRNLLLDKAGFRCEICSADAVGLHVHLRQGTPQGMPPYDFDAWGDYGVVETDTFRYFVVCRECLPRCSDLVDAQRGEFVKREFLPAIIEWVGQFQERHR